MRRVIVALAVFIFLNISSLYALDCGFVNEYGTTIKKAFAGKTIYFKSTYANNKLKKLSWSLLGTLPSTNIKNNKTILNYSGYFLDNGTSEYISRMIPIVIPENEFIEGTATFRYTLTGNKTCSANLPISQKSKPGTSISAGLKIFVTSEGHVGDFANDPYLAGTTAIAKADAFCNQDPYKPSDANYKALLVDGVNGDAVALIDWVLKPNTTYYRTFDDIVIGTTTASAILPAAYSDLTNSINDDLGFNGQYSFYEVWTGLDNASDFASSSLNCSKWSTSQNTSGSCGSSDQKDWRAFVEAFCSCISKLKLMCVEQP